MQIVASGQGKATWKTETLVNRLCHYAHIGSKIDTGLQGFAGLLRSWWFQDKTVASTIRPRHQVQQRASSGRLFSLLQTRNFHIADHLARGVHVTGEYAWLTERASRGMDMQLPTCMKTGSLVPIRRVRASPCHVPSVKSNETVVGAVVGQGRDQDS